MVGQCRKSLAWSKLQILMFHPWLMLLKNLMEQWETNHKGRMILTELSQLRIKIQEFEQQQVLIESQGMSIFVQQFCNLQCQTTSDKKAPWWIEVPDAMEEEEFINALYIKWCTIQPYDQEIQTTARNFMLFNPQITFDFCVQDNVVQPLYIQFLLDANFNVIMAWNNFPIAKFVKYSTNQRCKYEFSCLDSQKVNLIQLPYDKVSFERQCKRCSFISNEPSVRLEDDVKHLLHNCATFANYMGRDQNQIK